MLMRWALSCQGRYTIRTALLIMTQGGSQSLQRAVLVEANPAEATCLGLLLICNTRIEDTQTSVLLLYHTHCLVQASASIVCRCIADASVLQHVITAVEGERCS